MTSVVFNEFGGSPKAGHATQPPCSTGKSRAVRKRDAVRQMMRGFVIAVLWSMQATAQVVPPDATLLAIAVADLAELPESVAGAACISIGRNAVRDTALRAVRAQAPKLRWRAFEKECVFEGV